jgi:hypothetical protein
MIISALVLTLHPDHARRANALASLQADERLSCGQMHGERLPVVTEAGSLGDAESIVRGMADIEGVVFADVVSVHFEDELFAYDGGDDDGAP